MKKMILSFSASESPEDPPEEGVEFPEPDPQQDTHQSPARTYDHDLTP